MNYTKEQLLDLIAQITEAHHFGTVIPLCSEGLPTPRHKVRSGHPRVLVNPETLTALRRNLTAEENAAALADYRACLENPHDGKMSPLGEGVRSNFSWEPLSVIEAKAFHYLLDGDELSGYEAILILLNFLSTVKTLPYGRGDLYHCYGYTMLISSEVYDWCYPLMNDRVRACIVGAIESHIAPDMEIGFPPEKNGAFVGHGSEAQFLRDWYAFAIATADEYPDIYRYVSGKLERDYVPVRDYYFLSGMQSQGNCYGNSRNTHDLTAQFLTRVACGEDLFHGDLQAVARSFIYNLRPDDTSFRTGDDQGQRFDPYMQLGYDLNLFYAARLYRDAVAKEEAFRVGNNVLNFRRPISHDQWTGVHFLIWNDPTIGRESRKTLPRTVYFPSPVGHYIARSSWKNDAVCLFMKLGEKYSANHEHRDMGQFQIFYRRILASESGFYDRYGAPVDMHYSKQTIAHNCILIHDPSEDTLHIPNTGGQKYNDKECRTLDMWLAYGKAHTDRARILGHEDGTHSDGSPAYAYLAGDLTGAYAEGKAEEVLRYMHGVFTADAAHPLLFFVYDRVTATDEEMKKTFLLHFEAEPRICGDLCVIENGEGALVSRTLLPRDGERNTELIEGSFVINGEPLKMERNYRLHSTMEKGWGRLEVSPTPRRRTDEFFHAMYVTDAGTVKEAAPAVLYECDEVVGASLLGACVFFSRTKERISHGFAIEGEGDGELLWQVGGLERGAWVVRDSEGRSVGGYLVGEAGGLLTFRAPAGKYTLTH